MQTKEEPVIPTIVNVLDNYNITKEEPLKNNTQPYDNIPTTTVSTKQPVILNSDDNDKFGIAEILLMIYSAGAIVILFTLLHQVYYIKRLKRWAYKDKTDNNITVYRNVYVESPFSFGKDIFVDKTIDGDKLNVIVEHELAHINNRHYIDKFLIELFSVTMWFNPIIWIIRREIGAIHEFQSDYTVLRKGIPIVSYQQYLFEEIIENTPRVANGFNNSLIKKRFIMMKNGINIKQKVIRVIGTSITISLMFVLMSFNFDNQNNTPISKSEESSNTLSEFVAMIHNPDRSKINIPKVKLQDHDINKDIDNIKLYDIKTVPKSVAETPQAVVVDKNQSKQSAEQSAPEKKISSTDYILKNEQIISALIPYTENSRLLYIETTEDATYAVLAIPIHFDSNWIALSSKTILYDKKSGDKYLVRHEQHGIPFDKTCWVNGHKNNMIAITMVFPPLKKGVKMVDFTELPNENIKTPNEENKWFFGNVKVNSSNSKKYNFLRGDTIK